MIAHRASYSPNSDSVRIETNGIFGPQEMMLKCTFKQYSEGVRLYKAGAYMQDAFSFLSADEREFLISGLTPEQFEEAFPSNSDEE